ncbi:MAG: DUF3084 domain-containing protein [Armatimonadota bacterium]|nr:DUF3084 domain-containing protein [Armatimonadota bacterium]MDR7451347.1 DUF3084 domain-containing protein [Armatimonadota bacterium]MDR7466503.1 DUF3084 domain-containing protein [Armatimonadota bacterium]MDR7493225.1 DUF3084 domain-containing protein [Armatimonadota bacterium]MDR7499422.1 DUF3084 domain-containing protein [Armatimonadota bacterium]
MELGALLIPVLILLSGAIALVGNAVGRNIGRRRLSVFGLRPRYTAQIVTVLTGMLITVTTLLVVLTFSQEARVALFRLNEVLQETRRLEGEIQRQEERLKQLALGDIAYLTNQEVVREVIDGSLPTSSVRQRLEALVERAGELARRNGIGVDASGRTLLLTPPNVTWETIASLVDQRDAGTVVRLVASQNTLRGEPLPVFVQLFDNRRVYRSGAVLIQAVVDGRKSAEGVGQDLLRLADESAHRARGQVLAPPGTIVTSPPNAVIDVDDHRDAVARIVALRRPVTVRVVAAQDIYTTGPLAVAFVVVR